MDRIKKSAIILIAAAFLAHPVLGTELDRLSFEEFKALASEKVSFLAVDCDAGGDLARAARNQAPDLVIWFIGTCEVDEVTIERDDVVIRGFGEQSTLVGGIVISGSSRIRLRDFYIRDSALSGILLRPGSQAEILGINIQDPGFRGILLEGANAEIRDVKIERSATVGILNRSSHVQLFGTVEATGAGVAGLSATLGASYFTDDETTIIANDNANGLIIQLDSTMEFAEGRLEANNNAGFGVLIASESSLAHGTVEIVAQGNVIGMAVGENSSLTPFVGFGATIDVSDNLVLGVLLVRQGILDFGPGTTISGNAGPGIVADESSLVVSGTTVTGNAPDIVLDFTATGTFGEDNDFGSPIICTGPSIETRGTAGCGGAAARSDVERYTKLFKSRVLMK